MDLVSLSVVLAKWVALYLIVIGIFVLLRQQFFRQAALEIFKYPSLTILSGALALSFGLLIVVIHPVFEVNWRGLLTLVLGILPILQGIVRLFFAQEAKGYVDKITQDKGPTYIGAVSILLGLFFAYFGYFG